MQRWPAGGRGGEAQGGALLLLLCWGLAQRTLDAEFQRGRSLSLPPPWKEMRDTCAPAMPAQQGKVFLYVQADV